MSDLAVSIGFNRSMFWESITASSICTRRVEGQSKPSLSQVVYPGTMTRSLASGEAVRKLEKQKAVEGDGVEGCGAVFDCSIANRALSWTTIAGPPRPRADAEGRMSTF